MTTLTTEPTMSQEIQGLRDHFEARFTGLEKWLERVTTAVEKQSEQKERLIIVETRLTASEERVRSLEAKVAEMQPQLVKYGVYCAGGLGVLTLLGPFLLKKFFGV
ncbi:hypothetical protein [Azospirillum argentinense]|uniref:hypothetical protein n=1 Tax=Azospirillum argentinense TaxID=2970906 RepID=UPI0032DE969D